MTLLLSIILLLMLVFAIGLRWLHHITVHFAHVVPQSRPSWPAVSVIVPIHNGGDKLDGALRSLCEMDYPALHIVAVNDRSIDKTAEVLTHLSKQYAHLSVITVDQCPEAWLGKVYALHQGIQNAKGDYFLLTDADVVFDTSLLKRVMNHVIEHDIQQFSVLPQVVVKGFWFRVTMLAQSLLFAGGMVMNRGVIGIGAFNLVSKTAVEKIGGMAAIALAPVDDFQLSKEVQKRQCGRQGIGDAGGMLQVEWYSSLREMVNGLEKNTFAFLGFSLLRAVMSLSATALVFLLPIIGMLFLSGSAFTIAVLIYVLTIGIAINQARKLPIPIGYGVLYPVGIMIALWIAIRAIVVCMVRGGIHWGGKFYPLRQLRAFRDRII